MYTLSVNFDIINTILNIKPLCATMYTHYTVSLRQPNKIYFNKKYKSYRNMQAQYPLTNDSVIKELC